jgi:transcriptional regulator with XRE-family HTH domain
MTPAELVDWRTARGLTLDELAAQLDVSRMTIWKWEHGRHPIPRLLDLALQALEQQPVH